MQVHAPCCAVLPAFGRACSQAFFVASLVSSDTEKRLSELSRTPLLLDDDPLLLFFHFEG